jgi:hypothetical protein
MPGGPAAEQEAFGRTFPGREHGSRGFPLRSPPTARRQEARECPQPTHIR